MVSVQSIGKLELTFVLFSSSIKVISTPSLQQLLTNDEASRIQLTIENPKDFDIDVQVSVILLSSDSGLAPSESTEKLSAHEPFSVPTVELAARSPMFGVVKLLAYEDDLLRDGTDANSDILESISSDAVYSEPSSWGIRSSHNLAALSIPVAINSLKEDSLSAEDTPKSKLMRCLNSDVVNEAICCNMTLRISVSRSPGIATASSDELSHHGPYELFVRTSFRCDLLLNCSSL